MVTTFGEEGTFAEGVCVALQPDGKIVVAGDYGLYATAGVGLVRYLPDGSLDQTFGINGRVQTPYPDWVIAAYSVAIQADGRIVIAGGNVDIYPFNNFEISEYLTDGTLDTSFDNDGMTTTDFAGLEDVAQGVVVQPDGRILVAGLADNGKGYDFAIARYYGGPSSSPSSFDYDGDGRSDISVWRPSDGNWYVAQSGSGTMSVRGWGLNGDKLAPADFDGDGKTDLAVFRESDSNWYIFNSLTNTATTAGWGLAGDLPVPADYGGDGKADIAVYRPSEGNWYRRDSDGQIHVYAWGLVGDKPAPADSNGDGVADMTVFRPSEGKWYTINSGSGAISQGTWGIAGDQPVPGDYSGDGKADFAVYRPSNQTWYRIHSDNFSIHIITWGLNGDFPTPGDYDGDGKQDLAVFRPSNATWFINSSTAGIYSQPFGLTGDIPTPNAFVY